MLSLTPLVSLGILLVIFLLFALANMMTRPDLFRVMMPSDLLLTVLTFLNRKRRKMIEKIRYFIKALFLHFANGCDICAGFARHFAKTLVQILKGGNYDKKS